MSEEIIPIVESEEETELTPADVALRNLSMKQQRFVHLYLTGQYTLQKLGQLLEVHPNTLNNWLKKQDVKLVIESMQSSTHEIVSTQLKALSMKAVGKLNGLIDSPIDGVALQAVKDVLDRAGHKSKQEIKVEKTVRTYEEKIKDLIESTIVEGEFEVVEE